MSGFRIGMRMVFAMGMVGIRKQLQLAGQFVSQPDGLDSRQCDAKSISVSVMLRTAVAIAIAIAIYVTM